MRSTRIIIVESCEVETRARWRHLYRGSGELVRVEVFDGFRFIDPMTALGRRVAEAIRPFVARKP